MVYGPGFGPVYPRPIDESVEEQEFVVRAVDQHNGWPCSYRVTARHRADAKRKARREAYPRQILITDVREG